MDTLKKNTNQVEKELPPEEAPNKSGKVFLMIFSLLIAGSVFATYYRMVILKNYTIEAQVDCDPAEQACFIWECDPGSDVDGEKCTGDIEKDIWYYNLAKRKATHIPLCNPATDETCTPMACNLGEKNCEEIFCDEKNSIEQEAECSDPTEYLKNTLLEEEEEEEECTLDDDECQTSPQKTVSTDQSINQSDSALSE
jgi:hypothetical protein